MNDHRQTYIVAVSGGVDSVVLLHMIHEQDESLPPLLRQSPHIVVAHVDHGIRGDSGEDLEHVRQLATQYGYKFESTALQLGHGVSEERARDARYQFLDMLMHRYHAEGVITAHHRDDVYETAIINLLRGTGRRGLSSLKSQPHRIRPLLHLTKQQIREYANNHGLEWREDSTNADPSYTRNRIRLALQDADEDKKLEFATKLQKISETNDLLDAQIATILQYKVRNVSVISRSWFVKLDHAMACEFMAAFLRLCKVQNIDRALIEKLVVVLKAGRPGARIDIDKDTVGLVTKRSLRLMDRQTGKTRSV